MTAGRWTSFAGSLTSLGSGIQSQPQLAVAMAVLAAIGVVVLARRRAVHAILLASVIALSCLITFATMKVMSSWGWLGWQRYLSHLLVPYLVLIAVGTRWIAPGCDGSVGLARARGRDHTHPAPSRGAGPCGMARLAESPSRDGAGSELFGVRQSATARGAGVGVRGEPGRSGAWNRNRLQSTPVRIRPGASRRARQVLPGRKRGPKGQGAAGSLGDRHGSAVCAPAQSAPGRAIHRLSAHGGVSRPDAPAASRCEAERRSPSVNLRA